MKFRISVILFLLLTFGLNQKSTLAQSLNSELDSLETILPFASEKDRADILNGIALNIKGADTAKAGAYARQALLLSKKYNNCKGEATSQVIIGILAKMSNNYILAKSHYISGLSIGLKCKDPFSISLAYHSLGILAQLSGEYHVAIRYYIASLKLSEKIKDYKRMVRTLNNISTIYLDLKDFNRAEENFLRAYKINELLNDELTSAELANNLGNIYAVQNMQLKALYYYTTALTTFRRLGSIYDISHAVGNIGFIYNKRDQPAKAKPFLLESYIIDKKVGDAKSLSVTTNNLANAYLHLNKLDSAEYYVKLNIDLCKGKNLKPELADSYWTLGQIYKEKGEHKKANEYLLVANKMRDEITSIEKQSQIKNLVNEYEAERKAAQVKLLAKENEIKELRIREQTAQLEARNLVIWLGSVVVFFLLLTIVLFIYLLNIKKQTKEIELTNYTKTNLLSRINHELRTPLNSVIGMSQLANESKTFNELKGYLTNIKLSSEELTFTLNNIVNYLQIEQKQVQPAFIPFNILDMLEDCFKIYELQCKSKGIVFSQMVHSGVPDFIYTDRQKLLAILDNLFFNAFQNTNRGVVRIDVKSIAQKRVNDNIHHSLRLQITDEGVGLTETQIKNLFKGTKTNKEFGLGIGLKIVKNFTKLLNAHLTVTSEVGKGSIFILEIDVQQAAGNLVEPKSVYRSKNALSEVTALVAEDNVLNQKLMSKILEKEGVSYILVSSGDEALEAIREKSFDILLLDLSLPNTNGLEVAYKIRNSEEFEADKNLPIIAVSANEDAEEQKRCFEIGINDYISKPMNKEALLKKISRMLLKSNSLIKNSA